MKIQSGFAPVSIILESQKEVDYLFALVNHVTIYDLHLIFQSLQKKLLNYRSDECITIHDKINKKIN